MDPSDKFLITSPNANFIPEIIQGMVSVVLRSDGKYGAVDPIQWPQLFTKRYGYLSAVLKPVQPPHPWAPIFTPPSEQDFVPHTGTIVSGFGLLTPTFIAPLSRLVEEMSQCVADFVGPRGGEEYADIRWHEVAMRHALNRLRLMPATFLDQLLQVNELQRHWLMAAAYLEYQRRLRNLQPLPGGMEGSLPLMGAWSTNPSEVQLLFDAGIPVWFVRSAYSPCGDIRIKERTSPVPPTSLQSARFPGTDAVLFHGLVGESHLSSMMQGGHGYLDISRVPTAAVYSDSYYGTGATVREAKSAARNGTSLSAVQSAQALRSVTGGIPSRSRPKPCKCLSSSV